MSARSLWTSTVVPGILLCLMAALSACGNEQQSDREAIRSTVTNLQGALAVGDMEAACSELTAAAQKHVGGAAHEPPTTCERDLVMIYRGLEKGTGLREPGSRAIERVTIDGDRARVMVKAAEGPAFAVPVAEEDGDWKVDALYGGLPGGSQEDNFD